MNITTSWLDSQRRVLLQQIGTHWTWDDWAQSTDDLCSAAQSSASGLVLVCDVPADVSLPPSGFSENMRMALACHSEARVHAVIYAMKNPALRTLWQQAIERYADHAIEYRFVDTLDDACDLALSAV